MSSQPVALILGSGPRVGNAVVEKFLSEGYNVATASRKGTDSLTANGCLSIQADFSDPASIAPLFGKVQAEFGVPPSIVVYNAAALTPPPEEDAVLSISASSVAHDLQVNTISAYVAAQEAVKAWSALPKEVKKTFIYTGNGLNVNVSATPMMLNLGMGKAASAYWVGAADMAFAGQGVRFFYADERAADGRMKGMALDGQAHADFYATLAKDGGDVPWHATFVKGQGYVQVS